jgi:hypothetical protein
MFYVRLSAALLVSPKENYKANTKVALEVAVEILEVKTLLLSLHGKEFIPKYCDLHFTQPNHQVYVLEYNIIFHTVSYWQERKAV